MSDVARKSAGLVLRLAVTAVLLYVVARQVDFGQFHQAVHTTVWRFVFATWLLTALFSLVQSIALRVVLRRQNCHVRLNTLFGASAITALYSLILPGVLSTGIKWYVLKRDTGRGSQVFSSMVYNQMTLFVTMTVIGLIAVLVRNPFPPGVSEQMDWVVPVVAAALLVLIVLSSALLLSRRTGRFVIRVFDWLLRPWPTTVRLKGHDVLEQIATFQTAGARFHLKVAAINAFDAGVICVLSYVAAARAAGIRVPLGMFICLCASVYVLSKLPVTLANLGFREVTLVGLLAGHGVSQSAALLMSMILFSSLIFMAALGVVYQLVWGVHPQKPAGRSDVPEPVADPSRPGKA
ncbi:MAG: lysylphosphatidylglycerol synthase transmembrane domain-containing protein [Phycisphaerales bacterium]